MPDREELIREIVGNELLLFEKVHNCGGHACCQDDWGTFEVLRASLMEAWTPELLESYRKDLETARAEKQNLLCQRYAYMLVRAQPETYAALRERLPEISPERRWLAEWITAAMVRWRIEAAARYPALVSRGRAIRSDEDRPGAVSFETYLSGELMTYSVETLRLYAAYIERLTKAGRNLDLKIWENVVRHYGYNHPDAAEEDIKEQIWQKAL